MTSRRRLAAGGGDASGTGAGRGFRQSPNAPRGEIAGPIHLDVADDDGGELARREAVGMQPEQPLAGQALHGLDRALRRAAVRMAARVQQRHQRFGRAYRRIVLVLANRRHDLAFARRDLVFGKRRLHQHLAEQREHRLEILRQAGADERQDVPRHRESSG